MDKSTRALYMAEDGNARIDVVEKSVRAFVKARTAVKAVNGALGGGATSFGTFDCGADTGAAAVAFDGGACELSFGGTTVASGNSPLFATFSGAGELKLGGERQNARALIIGAK